MNESNIPIRNADVPIGINPTPVTRYSQQRLRRQSTIQNPPPRPSCLPKYVNVLDWYLFNKPYKWMPLSLPKFWVFP